MIVAEMYEGDSDQEYLPYDPERTPHYVRLVDIPEPLWLAYSNAVQMCTAMADTVAIVGREIDPEDFDLVWIAEHLTTHHGMDRAMAFRAALADLGVEHDEMHAADHHIRIPHVHGGS